MGSKVSLWKVHRLFRVPGRCCCSSSLTTGILSLCSIIGSTRHLLALADIKLKFLVFFLIYSMQKHPAQKLQIYHCGIILSRYIFSLQKKYIWENTLYNCTVVFTLKTIRNYLVSCEKTHASKCDPVTSEEQKSWARTICFQMSLILPHGTVSIFLFPTWCVVSEKLLLQVCLMLF